MWCAATATIRIWWSPPTRAPPPSPTSPTRSRSRTITGSATLSPRAARPATTTRRSALPRGAWESVKRHFREMDLDIGARPLTVVGVGDMSGDVFGNGMLREQTIRLVAAFDHRDIFIDPEPDAARTFAERRRLFDLPRSSWQDFDKSFLSPGGGIYSRAAKEIRLSPQAQKLLGTGERLTPAEVMRAI